MHDDQRRPNQPPNDEAETRPGGLAGIAGLIGATVAAAAVVLVAWGWLSMAVSVLTPIVLPPDRIADALDDDAHFAELPGAMREMPPDFVGGDMPTAHRISATLLRERAKPFPADGQPARSED
jgi:hypothetical protein